MSVRVRLVFDDGGSSDVRSAPFVRVGDTWTNDATLAWDVKAGAPGLRAVEVADVFGVRYLEVPRDAQAAAGRRVVIPRGSLRWTDRVRVGDDS